MSHEPLHILCAGAAQGLVTALRARFAAAIDVRFGAVGAMKEALLGGAPCDVMIVTDAMLLELQAAGALAAAPRSALGRVRTGVATRSGDATPSIDTPDALKQVLLAAPAIYSPDARRSTAGIHFASVLQGLGIAGDVATRLHTFANGATAMRELAAGPIGAIGCTQISEIMATPGTALLGPLPRAFELATLYSAALGVNAAQAGPAAEFVELLTGPATRAVRIECGFEPD